MAAKLEAIHGLDPADGAALEALLGKPAAFAPHAHLRGAGDQDRICVVASGWAALEHISRDGRRQIVQLLLPGDHVTLTAQAPGQRGLSVTACGPVTAWVVAGTALETLRAGSPRLHAALDTARVEDMNMARRRVISLSSHDTAGRLAHLLCELWERASRIALVIENQLRVPLNQGDLADAIGVTSVHVNRVLQRFRAAGMLRLADQLLSILDHGALRRMCDFDPRYLYPERGPLSLPA